MNKEKQFNALYIDNKDKIYRVCCFYIQDKEERKDLFQEILTNIWKGLDRFEGRSKISTWIYRIAVNTSMAYYRKQNRDNNKKEQVEQAIYRHSISQSSDNEQEAILNLHKAIKNLNKIEKAIVSLMFEDIPQKEIAHILGFSENNIRVKIHRIKSKLKSILIPENHGY